jgi:hypothetical protein
MPGKKSGLGKGLDSLYLIKKMTFLIQKLKRSRKRRMIHQNREKSW